MGVVIIANPVSGGGRGGRNIGLSVAVLGRRYGAVEVLTTAGPGDASRFARQAAEAGAGLIVALGGDGTISECASGILISDRPDTPLAFVPSGTGCDFAANFGDGTSCEGWIERITWPETRRVDAGRIRFNGDHGNEPPRFFNNIASLGVSGHIARCVNQARRLPFVSGKMLFFFHSLRGLIGYQPIFMRLTIDGKDYGALPITLAAIANGPRFGGGMKVAPMAELDDGLLDIIIIPAMPKWRIIYEFLRIYNGTHLRNLSIVHVRAKAFSAERVGDGAADLLFAEIDGESVECRSIDFTLRPSTLVLAM